MLAIKLTTVLAEVVGDVWSFVVSVLVGWIFWRNFCYLLMQGMTVFQTWHQFNAHDVCKTFVSLLFLERKLIFQGLREFLSYQNFMPARHPPLEVSDHHKTNVWDRRHGAAIVGRSENCSQKLLQQLSFGKVCKKPANFRRAPNILFVRICYSKGTTQTNTH